MSDITEVSKRIKLDLTGVPANQKATVKKEVADFLLNETLRYIDRGRSPVTGEKTAFSLLDKKYAKAEHNGNRVSRLQLDGDLLDAYKIVDDGGDYIKAMVQGPQAPKADGHNQISGDAITWAKKSGMPKRRFIPDLKQSYRTDIMGKIKSIISDYVVKPDTEYEESKIDSVIETEVSTVVTVADMFDADFLENLLLQELVKKGR